MSQKAVWKEQVDKALQEFKHRPSAEVRQLGQQLLDQAKEWTPCRRETELFAACTRYDRNARRFSK